jgi:hypothetical protein
VKATLSVRALAKSYVRTSNCPAGQPAPADRQNANRSLPEEALQSTVTDGEVVAGLIPAAGVRQ